MIGRTFLHYLGVLRGTDQPQTQTTFGERELLCSFLHGRQRIVEIGVFEGLTTRQLAECSDEESIIYGVDPFFPGRFGICWGKQIAYHYNRDFLMSGKVRLVCHRSTEVGSEVPPEVDLVFVDGDHTLSGISADWAFWSLRLVSGGLIALHDTVVTPDKPPGYVLGTYTYFRDYIQHDVRFEVVGQRESLSILRKREKLTTLGSSFT